jgi:hypothetical protein|tara:strand:+ start:152 stop:928 length:777 start_codon:yes stop_codon:yes gene_type:complete
VLPNILKPFKSNKSNLLRVGPKKDGGYIIDKRVINKSKTVITCGLNDDWEFEKHYLKINPEGNVIAYDHTVNKKFWKKRFKKDFLALILLKKINIYKILDVFKYIDYKFFFKKNIHVTKKVVLIKKSKNEISIKEILDKKRNIILKIDIEGDEYKILNVINKEHSKINLLIIEFHNISKNISKIKKFLSNSKFKIIHLHGNNYGGTDRFNNPNVIEVTFLNSKKFFVNKQKSRQKYPIIGLDFKNLKRRQDIKIKFND